MKDALRTLNSTSKEKAGFTCAGAVVGAELNVFPPAAALGRARHKYGDGPFAQLVMPPLPGEPGVYLWTLEGDVVYVGQTTCLRKRFGPNGYATITAPNTLAHEHGLPSSGQTTNCRVNALANEALVAGQELSIWYRLYEKERVASEEARWMESFGVPAWNVQPERVHIDSRSPFVEYDLHHWPADATADLMRLLLEEGIPYRWESRGTLLTVESRFEGVLNSLVSHGED